MTLLVSSNPVDIFNTTYQALCGNRRERLILTPLGPARLRVPIQQHTALWFRTKALQGSLFWRLCASPEQGSMPAGRK